jgi:endonuclease/exonuclease/phosphatase family metal-dependent hydrolase
MIVIGWSEMVRLRFLTLNVWSIPWPVSRDIAERMRAIGRRISELRIDVAAFQEVWTGDARRRLVDAGREAGLDFAWHGEGLRGASGLVVLSRLPIRSARFQAFTLNGLPQRIHHLDYYGGKGLAHLSLDAPGGPLSLVTTHLHARHADGQDRWDYTGHRSAQVVELAGILAHIDEPLVSLGDFNIDEGSPPYRALLGLTGLQDAAAVLDQRQHTTLYDNPYRRRGRRPGRRIDYLFTRDGAKRATRAVAIRRVLDEHFEIGERLASYSDHAGLLCDVELGGLPSRLPPPAPSSLALAKQLLTVGRRHAELRQSQQRLWAASGAVACLTTLGAGRSIVASRRRFLRAAALGLPAIGLASCAGLTALAERFVPQELRGYDRVEAILDELARRGTFFTERDSRLRST